MPQRMRHSPSRDAMSVFCECNHTKNAHFVKKQGCITCECKKYKERKVCFK